MRPTSQIVACTGSAGQDVEDRYFLLCVQEREFLWGWVDGNELEWGLNDSVILRGSASRNTQAQENDIVHKL